MRLCVSILAHYLLPKDTFRQVINILRLLIVVILFSLEVVSKHTSNSKEGECTSY